MSHRDLADAVPVHQTLDPATAGATITLHETTQRRALEMLQSTEADLCILSDLPKGASHSVKISAVCSPSMGGGKDGVGGISSKRIGLAIKRTSPDAGCFMVCTMPRSLSCGVSQTSLTVLRRHRGWPRHRCGAQHLSPWRPVPAFPRRSAPCHPATSAAAAPTRPKPRPASPDDLKARLKVTRFAKYHASDKTALVGCVR